MEAKINVNDSGITDQTCKNELYTKNTKTLIVQLLLCSFCDTFKPLNGADGAENVVLHRRVRREVVTLMTKLVQYIGSVVLVWLLQGAVQAFEFLGPSPTPRVWWVYGATDFTSFLEAVRVLMVTDELNNQWRQDYDSESRHVNRNKSQASRLNDLVTEILNIARQVRTEPPSTPSPSTENNSSSSSSISLGMVQRITLAADRLQCEVRIVFGEGQKH
jgi:hypothetical protein